MTGISRGGVLGLVALLTLWAGLAESQGDGNNSCGSSQFDLVIILDTSTSVQPVNWNKTLLATQRLVRDIDFKDGNVRIGVLIFSNEAKVIFHLNAYQSKADIIDAVSRIPYEYGQTNTAGALKLMRTAMFSPINGDRTGVPNVAIVITDGESTIDKDKTVPEANKARQQGIQIFAIGIGLSATAELDGIAGRTENRYFIDNFDELDDKMERIYRNLCPETTTQPPTTVASTTPKGPCTETDIDLIFVLDTSTSVTEKNFRLMIAAVKHFVSNADIDSGNTRIGIITYSTQVRVEFDLNRYTTKERLLNAVNDIKYIRGDTNTADAIKLMRTRSFSAFYGDREDIPNVAVVVTDGVSNINHFKTIPEAELARESGIDIYAIGVGVSKTEELDAIAGKAEHRFDIEKFEELEFNLEAVYKKFCVAGTPTKAPDILCSSSTLDVVFVLDSSTSMGKKNFRIMLDATKAFISSQEIDTGKTRIGMLVYSTDSSIKFHLNQYITERQILKAVDNIDYMAGSTNTAGAIQVMRDEMFKKENGARDKASKVGIIITDGVSNINYHRTIPEAELARDNGIVLLAIGVGLSNTLELDGIAGRSENKLNIDKFEELEFKLDTFFRSVCNDVVIFPDLPKLSCGKTDIDIVFVLDVSTYISEHDFQKLLKTIQEFSSAINVEEGRARMGLLVYNSAVIYLNSFSTNTELLRAISNAIRPSIQFPFSESITFLNQVMFSSTKGDRYGVPNIAVIVTDGRSDFVSTKEDLKALQSKGTRVLLVGIGIESVNDFYNVADFIATETALLLRNFDQLDLRMNELYNGICLGDYGKLKSKQYIECYG